MMEYTNDASLTIKFTNFNTIKHINVYFEDGAFNINLVTRNNDEFTETKINDIDIKTMTKIRDFLNFCLLHQD